MIQNLENKMELQINSLEPRIEKMQDMLNKDLEEIKKMSSSEFWDVYGFGVTLGSLYIKVQGYVPRLPENLCGLSCSGTCWLLGGAWFQCRYGGLWMSSH